MYIDINTLKCQKVTPKYFDRDSTLNIKKKWENKNLIM
jgi:hypothetical protein